MKMFLQPMLKFAVAFFFIALCNKPSHAQVSDEELKQTLLTLELALNTGVKTHDTTALKQILANEFQLSGPRFPGAVRRIQWLSNIPDYSLDSSAINNVSVTNLGEIAIFRSLQHFFNQYVRGNPSSFNECWITDLWIKRNDRWQLVTRLSERLPMRQ